MNFYLIPINQDITRVSFANNPTNNKDGSPFLAIDSSLPNTSNPYTGQRCWIKAE